MKIGQVISLLWKRHRWEVCLFLLISSILSVLLLQEEGERFHRGLVWLEVGSLVWLVTRVALTQSGFGTFAGWNARPVRRRMLWTGECLFLLVPLMIAGMVRLFVGGELIEPDAGGWQELTGPAWTLLAWLGVLFGVCKIIGIGWEWNDSPRVRRNFAWGVILVVVVGALVPVVDWGNERVSSGGGSGIGLSPVGNNGVKDWQWLRESPDSYNLVSEVRLTKMPLRKGETREVGGLRIEITDVQIKGERIAVRWRSSRFSDLASDIPFKVGVMVSFRGEYFGVPHSTHYKQKQKRVPLLNLRRSYFSSSVISPLALPENRRDKESLLEGAEFWVTFDEPEKRHWVNDRRREIPENKEERIRWGLSPEKREVSKVTKAELNFRGAEMMNEVLAAEPWSEVGWEQLVKPYLLKYAEGKDLPHLVKLLERNPWMGDFFLEKGWEQKAEPILRKHLRDGKRLSKQSVIYLARLGEAEMADELVNQLLRMRGDFDAVAEAVRKHPGVNWDEVRQQAWRRLTTGFGHHHVWVLWGAEMGEKEALRQLLVEADKGKKWEKAILEQWFGAGVVSLDLVRESWERIKFVEGRWRIE